MKYPGCVLIGISAMLFSLAHWGKPIKMDLITLPMAAFFLAIGLMMVLP